jgi:hypothetical protein
MYAGFQEPQRGRPLCREHGELRHLPRSRRRHNQTVSASLCRSRFTKGAGIALRIMQSA